MADSQRLSRKDRIKLRFSIKPALALTLGVLLLILVVGKSQWNQLKDIFRQEKSTSAETRQLFALCDSIIFRADASFLLTDSAYYEPSLSASSKKMNVSGCRRIVQPWPVDLPFEFYVQRLQELARKRGLLCDCSLNGTAGRMACNLRMNNIIAGEAIVVAEKSAGLRGRTVAFLFNDLDGFDRQELQQLLDSRIKFSYFGSLESHPTGMLKRELEKAGISSVLLVRNETSFQTESVPNRKRSSSGDSRRREINLLFDSHPNPVAVYFQDSKKAKREFAAAILERTRIEKLAYLYTNSKPDMVDSMAYAGGLTIINMNSLADFSRMGIFEWRPRLLESLVLSSDVSGRILLVDSHTCAVDELMDTAADLHRLGVNLLSFMVLCDTVESF